MVPSATQETTPAVTTADARRSHGRRPYYERGVNANSDAGNETDLAELPQMTEREILVEALAYAVTNHQLDAARLLLDRGADVNARPEAIPRWSVRTSRGLQWAGARWHGGCGDVAR